MMKRELEYRITEAVISGFASFVSVTFNDSLAPHGQAVPQLFYKKIIPENADKLLNWRHNFHHPVPFVRYRNDSDTLHQYIDKMQTVWGVGIRLVVIQMTSALSFETHT